jgi:hypothetical protein
VESPLYACKETEVRYAIARCQGQGLVVEVFQDPQRTEPDVCLIFEDQHEDRKVEADGYHHPKPDYCNLEGMGLLADIIVRGIRSLEEEKATRARGVYVDSAVDYDAIESRYHDLPGHGAG